MSEVVLLEVTGPVALITLNRPGARNALSSELLSRLTETMSRADADDAVDAIILTGADPAFCAGLDLKELGSGGGPGPMPDFRRDDGTRGPFGATAKPVIGAINGVAVTGGLELALACDFLIASDRARFADTHARVGIQPGWGLTVLLPEAIGMRRAREMSATGNFVDAATALQWGLVNHVVAHDELLGFAKQLAGDIASNDGRAVRQIYATYDDNSLATPREGWETEGRVVARWNDGHFSASDIESRRAKVAERGRDQL
ncbi:MAG TPA: enoyl-CoA hydratase [Acidimicrobiales bacterium]|nr:enoyl-CoA hydratase [Acidimicrobiales bacterium]